MSTELTKHVENNLMTFLGKYKGQIETVLPKHLTPTRVLKLIVGAINRDPKIASCTPMSVINAVLTAATMGLEIRPGSAYLVPFKDNKNRTPRVLCTLLIDYRGKIDLASRSGKVTDITPEVVYSKDKFRIWRDESGLQRLEHEPTLYLTDAAGDRVPLTDEKQRGVPIGAYAIAAMKDGPPKIVFMPKIDILKIKERSRAKSEGPWVTDEMEMWKKTLVHRICKTIPQSPELAMAQDVDDRVEMDLPMDSIIEVEMDREDDQPILPESAEAADAVAQRKIAEMKASGLKPVTQADIDAEIAKKNVAEAVPLTDEENRALDAEIVSKENGAEQADKPKFGMKRK